MSQAGNGVGLCGRPRLRSGEGSGAIGTLVRIAGEEGPIRVSHEHVQQASRSKVAPSVAFEHRRELLSQVIRRLVAVFSTLLQLFAQAPFFNLAVEGGDLFFRRT